MIREEAIECAELVLTGKSRSYVQAAHDLARYVLGLPVAAIWWDALETERDALKARVEAAELRAVTAEASLANVRHMSERLAQTVPRSSYEAEWNRANRAEAERDAALKVVEAARAHTASGCMCSGHVVGLPRPCTCGLTDLRAALSAIDAAGPRCTCNDGHARTRLVGSHYEGCPTVGVEAARKPRTGIYIASKTHHAEKWRRLRECGEPIISTWIDEAGPGESASIEDLWLRCVREPAAAWALVIYAEPGDVLKGAFVEVGSALASGVPVFVVGDVPGSWVAHPLVTKCLSLLDALNRAHGAHHDAMSKGVTR